MRALRLRTTDRELRGRCSRSSSRGYLSHDEELTADGRRNMGIGLSVCMSIVQAHGGTMQAENREIGGALFSFTLPLEERNYEDPREDSGN